MRLLHLPQVDSTNAWLTARWRDYPSQTALTCDTQTAGRGRLDRPWLSDCPGNLYLSMLFKPAAPPFPAVNMTQYASVILCRLLAEYSVQAQIKWPNDVLVEGRKIAGTLSKLVAEGDVCAALVLGLGVNLNASESFLRQVEALGKPATSLHLHTRTPVERDDFLHRYLALFSEEQATFIEKGFGCIRDSYIQYSKLIDKRVTIDNFGKQLTGIVKQITDQGTLIVEAPHGDRHSVTLGDMA